MTENGKIPGQRDLREGIDLSIPDWMRGKNDYRPETDRDGFLTRSMLTMMSLLAGIRENGEVKGSRASPWLKILFTIFTIVLLSLSQNAVFTMTILAVFLLKACFLPTRALTRTFRGALGGAVFSMLIMLPAIFLGSPRSMLTVSLKVFVSTGLVYLLQSTTPWNRLTEGFRFYHAPDLLILTLDLTIKYIALLGELSLCMLEAIRLRSVGRNREKGRTFSGVLGNTFLRSREMADEMYGAMVCRGFEGEYRRPDRVRFQRWDLTVLTEMIAFTFLFIWLK